MILRDKAAGVGACGAGLPLPLFGKAFLGTHYGEVNGSRQRLAFVVSVYYVETKVAHRFPGRRAI